MDFASSDECLNFTNNIQTSLQTRSPIGASILLMSYFSLNFLFFYFFWIFASHVTVPPFFTAKNKKLAVRGCSNVYLFIFYSQNKLTTWMSNGMCTDGPRKAARSMSRGQRWVTLESSRVFYEVLTLFFSSLLFSSLQFSSPFLFLESS